MVFDLTRNYVPESYSDSRDYRVFLRLLSIVTTVTKSNLDSFISLYNAYDCPDELLPLLASMVGYKYNEGLSVKNNRILIDYFPYLLRNRGSEYGIRLATALALNVTTDTNEITYSADNIVVLYDRESGLIRVFYPNPELIEKSRNLIEAVRPVGTRIELVPSSISSPVDELDLSAVVRARIKEYFEDDPQVGRTKVGFDIVNPKINEEGDNS